MHVIAIGRLWLCGDQGPSCAPLLPIPAFYCWSGEQRIFEVYVSRRGWAWSTSIVDLEVADGRHWDDPRW